MYCFVCVCVCVLCASRSLSVTCAHGTRGFVLQSVNDVDDTANFVKDGTTWATLKLITEFSKKQGTTVDASSTSTQRKYVKGGGGYAFFDPSVKSDKVWVAMPGFIYGTDTGFQFDPAIVLPASFSLPVWAIVLIVVGAVAIVLVVVAIIVMRKKKGSRASKNVEGGGGSSSVSSEAGSSSEQSASASSSEGASSSEA
jgi:hypothetical protein